MTRDPVVAALVALLLTGRYPLFTLGRTHGPEAAERTHADGPSATTPRSVPSLSLISVISITERPPGIRTSSPEW